MFKKFTPFSHDPNINSAEISLTRRNIGAGSFGTVHEGSYLNAKVAVKEIKYDFSDFNENDEKIVDFKKEAFLMTQLRHPNIVVFYGYCLTPLYLIMEFMPRTLSQWLYSSEDIEWPTRYRLSLEIAQGIHFLHERGILHRDLKSGNILLDEMNHAKISDFGSSQFIKNRENTLTGTPGWIPPEIWSQTGEYSKHSDIYSLGITFWESNRSATLGFFSCNF